MACETDYLGVFSVDFQNQLTSCQYTRVRWWKGLTRRRRMRGERRRLLRLFTSYEPCKYSDAFANCKCLRHSLVRSA